VLVLHVIDGQMTCKFYMIAALLNFIMNGQKVVFIVLANKTREED